MHVNRREWLYSLLGVSSLPAFLEAQDSRRGQQTGDDFPKLTVSTAEDVASGAPRFFSPSDFASFQRLGDLIMPAHGDSPGALQAEAPEFLDFLLSESPANVQELYRTGVRRLNQEAERRHSKSFAGLAAAEAAPILEPLSQPWSYSGPSDPFAQFLQAAKIAFFQAAVNSRPWAQAQSARRRSAGGVGLYWLPIE